MRIADLVTGLISLAFSALYFFYLIPVHIVSSIPQEQVSRAALRPTFLPYLAIVLFALLSSLLIMSTFRQWERRNKMGTNGRSLFQVGVVFVIAYAYTYALELVGFLISSPIFLAALVMFFGTRNLRLVVPVAVLFPLIVNYFFWIGFTVVLPEWSLW